MSYGFSFIVIFGIGVDHIKLLLVVFQYQITLPLFQEIFSAIFCDGNRPKVKKKAQVFDQLQFQVNFLCLFFSGLLHLESINNYTAFYNQASQIPQNPIFETLYLLLCLYILSQVLIVILIQMNQNRLRSFLVKIKEQFFSKLTTHKTTLSAQEVSLLLYKYSNQEPLILHNFLIKGTGKLNISWDDLLGYFQEEIFVTDEVRKLQINPLSATEILQSHQSGFQKLIQFIKQKETNSIQSIIKAPVQIAGKDVFIVCLDKQIVFYDYRSNQIIGNALFKYSKVRQKLYLKQEEKRLKKIIQSQKKEEEYLDKVQNLDLDRDKSQKRRQGTLQRLLTNNMKESVRGSQISSQKSNDRKFFKKLQTDIGVPRRRQKSNVLRIKNDDTSKIFNIFCQSTIQNSIKVANTFKESRDNFKKYIQLDRSVLQKEKKQVSFDYSSLSLHRNFKKELCEMKSTNFKLTKMRKSIDNGQLSYNRIKNQNGLLRDDEQLRLLHKNNKMDSLQTNPNLLQIATFNAYQNYILVSLFNRQIRLLSLKRTITNFQYTTVFQKGFKEIVTYLQMYQNKKNAEFRVVVGLQVNNKIAYQSKGKGANQMMEGRKLTNVIVYQLDQAKTINHKKFDEMFEFSAKFQPIRDFGLALFDEKGHLCAIELNGNYQQSQEKIHFDLALNNPSTNYRICINLVRNHRNLINFYLCCTAGYVYLFDRLCRKIKYHTRVNPLPILDMQLIKDDSQILALYSNGNIAILSSNHLQKYFVYQSYHDIFFQGKFLIFDLESFYLYNARQLYAFQIVLNQEKKFNQFKPIKIMNNRQKLKNKAPSKIVKQKQKVVKIIEGKGGKGDFFAILYENGEICLLDNSLKYFGSYFYFNISNIAEIVCNQQYQFIAILTEDNYIQIVNVYTQNVLFNLSFPLRDNQKERKPRSYTDSLKSSVFSRSKPLKFKSTQTVKYLQFLNSTNSGIFLSVISHFNTAHHFSQKGTLISSIQIQKACGDEISTDQLLYQQDQLLFLDKNSITILRRKSYAIKMVIKVSQHKLLKFKKSQDSSLSKIICVDQQFQVYSVDINSRLVKLLYSYKGQPINECFYFNQHYLFLQHQQRMSLIYLDSKQEIDVKANTQLYLYRIVKDQLIRVSKSSGKIMRLNAISRQFQQIII